MSLSKSLLHLRYLIRRGAIIRASSSVTRRPLTFVPLSASFNTSCRWCAEDGSSSSSSSDSESDSESDTNSTLPQRSPLGPENDDDNRQAVMKASLRFVRDLGWSKETLIEGAKSAGFEGEEKDMFPDGPGELVNLFEQHCNDKLFQYMEKLKEKNLEGTELVRPSVEHRLRMLTPYIEKWPQAMALKAIPPMMPVAFENLSQMVDDIWYAAGDRSAEADWYVERVKLGAIYTSTEFYMVQDESEDFEDTWKFLDDRLKSVDDVSRNQFEGIGRGVLDFLSAGIVYARNRIGEKSEKCEK